MKKTNAVDQRVGRRLRERRKQLQLTQEGLAASVGVTFQQLQKYERGLNRISASRLHILCRVLDVSPGYFFDAPTKSQHRTPQDDLYEQLKDGHCKKLNEAFVRIKPPEVRRAIIAFVEALGAEKVR